MGTNRVAIGSFFPDDGTASGLKSDGVVEFTEYKGSTCFADRRADNVGGVLDTDEVGK